MNDWLIVAICLFFSALCSGLEIAFNSLNRLQLEVEMTKNTLSAKIIGLFLKNKSYFISSLLLGNNITLVIYGMSMARIIGPWAESLLPSALSNDFVVLIVQTILSTLLVLFVGEFIPKTLFRINPNAILSFFALPTHICYCILYPMTWLYTSISELLIRYVFRIKVEKEEYHFSTVDLDDFIAEYADNEDADQDMKQEIQLFQNVIDFRSVKLRECMVPRNEIDAVSMTDSVEQVKSHMAETKHSKLIIYSENIDNIVGYVHLNDVVRSIADGRKATASDIMRHIDFFPETYSANHLLKHFVQKHQGVAVVVDEFGGTSGIVSVEDIVEEIFGEIDDEYDDEDNLENDLGNGVFQFSARLEIDYLNDTYKLDLPVSDDYETLAGMIIHYCENIPKQGSELVIGNYRFKILKATGVKLIEVEIRIINN